MAHHEFVNCYTRPSRGLSRPCTKSSSFPARLGTETSKQSLRFRVAYRDISSSSCFIPPPKFDSSRTT
jgi:hypothetical protein